MVDEQDPHCGVCYEDDDSELVWVEAWQMYVHEKHLTNILLDKGIGI